MNMNMKEYWQQLSPRERRMLIAMAVVVGITIIYFGMWRPLQNGIENNRKAVTEKIRQIKTMQQYVLESRELRGNPNARRTVTSGNSLLVTIEQTAKQKRLALQQVKPEGNDGVRLNLENVAFDTVIEWIAQLEQQYGIWVDDISVERMPEKGQVNSRIVLKVAS